MSIPSPAIDFAASVSIGRCPCGKCRKVLGFLHDEAGETFAVFSLDPAGARGVCADIQATILEVEGDGLSAIRCEGEA